MLFVILIVHRRWAGRSAGTGVDCGRLGADDEDHAARADEQSQPSRLLVLTTLTVHVSVTATALVLVAVLTNTFAPPASAGFWAVVSFAALAPTVVGYGLYWWLLRRAGMTTLNALLFLVAPATAVAGTLIFAEPFTLAKAAGFAACPAGVSLELVSEARSQPAATPATSSGSPLTAPRQTNGRVPRPPRRSLEALTTTPDPARPSRLTRMLRPHIDLHRSEFEGICPDAVPLRHGPTKPIAAVMTARKRCWFCVSAPPTPRGARIVKTCQRDEWRIRRVLLASWQVKRRSMTSSRSSTT